MIAFGHLSLIKNIPNVVRVPIVTEVGAQFACRYPFFFFTRGIESEAVHVFFVEIESFIYGKEPMLLGLQIIDFNEICAPGTETKRLNLKSRFMSM